MTLTLSTKGQIVLPAATRHRLGLKPGACPACRVRDVEIVLTPPPPAAKTHLVRDKLTGILVLASPPGTPPLTGDRVRALLADFP
ncbi:MAG: AbrB/MazE/SpoVT family DNA-binding domain-containing protein [Undibacterium sp.]|nr:AbrB/MazE/SpoVT family DNA-binding domain-containing protein [Opitutaceae bacterium]